MLHEMRYCNVYALQPGPTKKKITERKESNYNFETSKYTPEKKIYKKKNLQER